MNYVKPRLMNMKMLPVFEQQGFDLSKHKQKQVLSRGKPRSKGKNVMNALQII